MFISTTDDTTMFAFEGTVDGSEDFLSSIKMMTLAHELHIQRTLLLPIVNEEFAFAIQSHSMGMGTLHHFM